MVVAGGGSHFTRGAKEDTLIQLIVQTRRPGGGVVGGWQVSRRINWGTHFPYLADKGTSEQKPHVQLEL